MNLHGKEGSSQLHLRPYFPGNRKTTADFGMAAYVDWAYLLAALAGCALAGWVRVALCQLIVRRIPAVVSAAQRNARLGCRLSGVVRDWRRCTRR